MIIKGDQTRDEKDQIIQDLSIQIRMYQLDNLKDHIQRMADIAMSNDPDPESLEHHHAKADEIVKQIREDVQIEINRR